MTHSRLERRIQLLEKRVGIKSSLRESTLEIGGQRGDALWDEIIHPLYKTWGIEDPGIDDADDDLSEILDKCQVGGDGDASFIINVEKFEKLFTAYAKRTGLIGGTFKKKVSIKDVDILNEIRDFVDDNYSIVNSYKIEGFEFLPYAKSFILRGEFGESLRIGTAHYSQFNFTVNLVLKNGDFYLNYTGSELNLGVYRQGLLNFKREPQFRDWSKGRKEYDEIISKEIRLKSSPEDSVEEISEEVANYLKRIFSIFKKFKSRY